MNSTYERPPISTNKHGKAERKLDWDPARGEWRMGIDKRSHGCDNWSARFAEDSRRKAAVTTLCTSDP